jgi:hypothetical protein
MIPFTHPFLSYNHYKMRELLKKGWTVIPVFHTVFEEYAGKW